MTSDEFEQAKRLAQSLALPVRPLPTRRRAAVASRAAGPAPDDAALAARAGQPGARLLGAPAQAAAAGRAAGHLGIDGALHAAVPALRAWPVAATARPVHTLVFGTRLTNITHCLRHRDPDLALARADAMVQDWRGGTRIASNLAEFNRLWARRLLTGNAAMLLVTDGLDRDDTRRPGAPGRPAVPLRHQFIWLNPLLRFEGFAPRAAGIRAILPHVDRFLPMHNLASLADLGRALRSRHNEERHEPARRTHHPGIG